MSKSKTISVVMPIELINSVEGFCNPDPEMTPSAFIRKAIRRELSKCNHSEIQTLAELELKEHELFEIHPECRYAIVVKETLPEKIVLKLAEMLKQWLLSGDKFLVINGDVALVRLDGTEKVDEE